MSDRCDTPIPDERILDYLLGELAKGEDEALESHLFACPSCASRAERLAGLGVALNRAVPPILTPERFEALSRAGLVARVNPMRPGTVSEVRYPPEGRLLVHRLGGFALAGARRIDVELRAPSGEPIGRLEDVPFDPSHGEVLVACQHHFAETYPRDLVFGVERVEGEARERLGEFTVLHRLA